MRLSNARKLVSRYRYMIAACTLAVVVAALFVHRFVPARHKLVLPPGHPLAHKPSKAEAAANALVQTGNQALRAGRVAQAEQLYEAVIDKNGRTGDKYVTEKVARARYNLAMSHALRKDYDGAEKIFNDLLENYNGTKEADPYLGTTLREQAMLQHAICLYEVGKRQQSIAQLNELISAFPSGAHVATAQKYLRKYNGGKLTKEAEAVLRNERERQEKKRHQLAMAQAMCGPKALEAICKHYHVKSTAEKISKMAGTTEQGTTMLNLSKAAQDLGFTAKGVEVNLQGLEQTTTPAILFSEPNHYQVLESVGLRSITIYDPAKDSRRHLSKSELGGDWRGKLLVMKKDR